MKSAASSLRPAAKFTHAPAVIGEAHVRPLSEWPVREWLRRLKRPRRGQDPDMQTNPHQVNDLPSLLQAHGVTQMHTELTSHGGKLGVFLYFRLPNPPGRKA
jgi:hypothetical protein